MLRRDAPPPHAARSIWTWSAASARPCPGVTLSTDLIVGFPGETAEDFDDTMSLVEAVRYHSVFSFKYSPRPNTLAAKRMPDDVPEAEKTAPHRGAAGAAAGDPAASCTRRRWARWSRCWWIRSAGAASAELAGPHRRQHGGELPGSVRYGWPGGRDWWLGRTVPVRVTRAGPHSLGGELAGGARRAASPGSSHMLIEMTIKGLVVDPVDQPADRDPEGHATATSVLSIWVGVFEANAIAHQIENVSPQRPMTHDLLRNLIVDLGGVVDRVVVSDLRDAHLLRHDSPDGEGGAGGGGRAAQRRHRAGAAQPRSPILVDVSR